MLEEEELVPSVDSNVGLDKFGNPICPLIEAAKEKMIRPRDIEHGKTTGFSGKLSLGEQLVVE